MQDALLATLNGKNAPKRQFWESELEMSLDFHLANRDGTDFLETWQNKLTKQQRKLVELGSKRGRSHRRRTPQNSKGDVTGLFPYFLVYQFSKFKSKIAFVELAKDVLGTDVEEWRAGEEDFDVPALAIALYLNDPKHLPMLLCIDKMHKKGFARMVLQQKPPRSSASKLKSFMKPQNLREVLSTFDVQKRDGRTSEFLNLLTPDKRYQVFIRRAERPDHVLGPHGIIHGYRPEWIILDVFDSGRRVNISSTTVDVPLEIANSIASAAFGTESEYANESQVTYAAQLRRLLDILQQDHDKTLTFVELALACSPLEKGPKLKVSDPTSQSIGPALAQFAQSFGSALDEPEKIDSIKVLYCDKRISLIFEPHSDGADQFIVRYSDHRLNVKERRDFEDYFRTEYEIAILSTEKRHKRQS
ncbi:MAG: hypothetical protein WEB58_19895 [Planctomycetaceae bacterium]